MPKSLVWFRWLDIDWTLTKCLAAAGVFLMLVGGGLFFVLFKHVKGKVGRTSRAEVWDDINSSFGVGIRTDFLAPTMLYAGPAAGVKVQLKANIDSLRQAARRGDWLTFWLWPSLLSSWSIGVWLLFMAFCRRELLLAILISVIPGFILLVAWFMPWAAIYTNIDLNADAQQPAPGDDLAQPPQM